MNNRVSVTPSQWLKSFADTVSSSRAYDNLTARKDALEFIQDVLTSNGLTVLSKDKDGVTPLLLASAIGAPTVVELLIQLGSDINEKDNQGNGLLHYAFSFQSLFSGDSNSYILSPNYILNQPSFTDDDNKGLVPMIHWALQQGFDINEENSLGETPLFGLWLAEAAWPLKKLYTMHKNLDMAQKHIEASFRLCTKHQSNLRHTNHKGFNVYEALEHQHKDIWSVTAKDPSFRALFVKNMLQDSLKESVKAKAKSLKKM